MKNIPTKNLINSHFVNKIRQESLESNKHNNKLSQYEKERYADLHVIYTLRVHALRRKAKLENELKILLQKNICCQKQIDSILRTNNIFD